MGSDPPTKRAVLNFENFQPPAPRSAISAVVRLFIYHLRLGVGAAFSRVCEFACLSVRVLDHALKGKWLNLNTKVSVEI